VYPPIEPFNTGVLDVGYGHQLYYEECGNPQGFPVLFVHGGPGVGAGVRDRQFFDPARFHAILFDQRGCGRSTPYGSLVHNTTAHLIGDIEKLRENLGIEKWAVFGGSWGSTLALAYAEGHPDRVAGMVVRGIWFGTPEGVDWMYRGGAGRFYPEEFANFTQGLKGADLRDPIPWYTRQFLSNKPEIRQEAVRRWAEWETWLYTLVPDPKEVVAASEDENALACALIETHYYQNDPFPFDQILPRAAMLKGIPVTIVQGRYDMACPPVSAWQLHEVLPGSRLVIPQTAGHYGHDPVLEPALVEAMDKLDLGRALEQ
jgi:proline iminopeptidase